MAGNRSDDMKPDNNSADDAAEKPATPSQTEREQAQKDEMSKAQEDAAIDRAEEGGYQ